MELERWIVIEMRWKRKLGSRLSPEMDAILRPSSIIIIIIIIIISLVWQRKSNYDIVMQKYIGGPN